MEKDLKNKIFELRKLGRGYKIIVKEFIVAYLALLKAERKEAMSNENKKSRIVLFIACVLMKNGR